jgi:alpha-beta hydrolase superfamily lysophospholipase
MKRGRTVRQEYQDPQFIGKKLTDEEKAFNKKFIDLNAVQFPELNPIDMRVKGQGKELTLANYRYPSEHQNRKGIVYFNNGYGDYCARYAFFGKLFAQAGYDFVCMDPRGFGHSHGKRAFIESEQIIQEDTLRFHDLVNEKFGGKDVPKLQLGVSLGGLMSVKLSLARPGFYNGMGLIVPYMKLLN